MVREEVTTTATPDPNKRHVSVTRDFRTENPRQDFNPQSVHNLIFNRLLLDHHETAGANDNGSKDCEHI